MKGKEAESFYKKAVQSGDDAAIRRAGDLLYDAYFRLVFSVAFNVLQQKEDAEDTTSEAFTNFFLEPHRCLEINNIKYYLINSARFGAYKLLKKRQVLPDDMDVESVTDLDPYFGYSDSYEQLPEFTELNQEERAIVAMHVFYDFSFREIAGELGETTHSISGKYRRAKQKLKAFYKKEGIRP